MPDYKVTEINIFPIKSLGGVSLERVAMTDRGPWLDRRWMLVDDKYRFVTQREQPGLALLSVRLHSDYLIVQHADRPQQKLRLELTGPAAPLNQEPVEVSIWKSCCPALPCRSEVNDWFSEQLNLSCQLVYMPQQTQRQVLDPQDQVTDDLVSFADGYPTMIIGEASLADLNSRMTEPVSMDRFRTNLVFSGGEPFAEDKWRRIRIDDVEFQVVKPCARCVMTTINPLTATRGKEPLQTLSQYRRVESGQVMFGQNLTHRGTGSLTSGTRIEVLETV